MRTVTATEASRSFAALLDGVENGETVLVTRGGQKIAVIGPVATSNGKNLRELLSQSTDELFGADVASTRAVAHEREKPWSDD